MPCAFVFKSIAFLSIRFYLFNGCTWQKIQNIIKTNFEPLFTLIILLQKAECTFGKAKFTFAKYHVDNGGK